MSRKSRRTRPRRNVDAVELLEGRWLLAADLAAVSPASDAQFVNPTQDIVLSFDEAVSLGTGNITIKAGDDVLETIDVTSANVQIDGAIVTINPTNDLPVLSSLTIEVAAGTFVGQSVPVFSEDFEGVELIPFVVESDGNDDDTDWSEEIPEGWVKDNTDTPEGDPPEFFGFTIFDKESWVVAAEDQGRSGFDRGKGNVVVADGDEYDDGTPVEPAQFNVFLTTPPISLDGIEAGDATLKFDSSFRPYPTQVGLVDVSFDDGATWNNLLTLNDETVEGGTSSLARVNAREILPLNNPAGGAALVRFGMVEAGNDWWWAIDNVSVEIPGVGEAFAGSEWSFVTAPTLSPAQAATGASTSANLQISYNQDVKLTPGLGDVVIHRADDDGVVETIPVASDRVTANGPTVTIDPVADLDSDTEYYVTVDGFSIWDTTDATDNGITLFAEDFEELELLDSGLVGGLNIDNYVVVMAGVLDVQTAGAYTFGGNSDDGQLLAIDVAQDGLDLLDDEIIFDDNNHGPEDRLSTCAFEANDMVQSCVDDGDPAIELAVGEYAFEYWFYENGGGSGGEFFYAPGTHEIFDATEFALVGDDSKGIGLTEAGITATTYVSAVEDAVADAINSLNQAAFLVDGTITQIEGFPAEAQIPTADIWNTGGFGRFGDNHTLPGFEPPEPEQDWTPETPEGWTTEENIPQGGAPEFEGWTFQDKDFWIAQQGDQARTSFTKGQGTVAVSDPDATDDFVPLDPLLYQDVFLITPEIEFSGLDPNSIRLEFDSSFRPYDIMTGLVDVSFDNGDTWDNLLTLVGTGADGDFPNSSLERVDETVVLDVNNPREGSVKFRWGMDEADNDWWWAIDNIRVTSPFSGNPLPGINPRDWTFGTGEGGATERLVGDSDDDGDVDFQDFLILSNTFGQTVEPGTGADFDADGDIDFQDFLGLSNNFGAEAVEVDLTPEIEVVEALFA